MQEKVGKRNDQRLSVIGKTDAAQLPLPDHARGNLLPFLQENRPRHRKKAEAGAFYLI